ncbi:MAG: cation transporter [Candidatus Buchananbacteria bacterium]|nr:cation transporter [Candidatus Buchananbacteria bacterium]
MSHNHSKHSDSSSREKNITIAVCLNIAFTIIEIIGGLWTNSLAILSDALHDFGDSVALITSLILERKAQKNPDQKRTFGYKRLSLFSAFFAASVLVGGSLFILSQAIPRLLNPEHANAGGMIGLAVLGIIFNGIGFFRLKKGSSMNEKVLSWHLLEDVMGWGVILIGAVIMQFWDNHLIDPLLTIGFISFTLWGVSKNLKETFNIFLQGVPAHIDLEKVKQAILSVEGVKGVHDIHIWSIEGETDILTAHIVVDQPMIAEIDRVRDTIKKMLTNHHIEHSTLEVETDNSCTGTICSK